MEELKKFWETRNLKNIFKNELDKDCFSHDAAYSDSKDVAKRTISDNILREKDYEISRNRENDGYQKGLASMVCSFFWQENRSRNGCKWRTSSRIIQTSY